MITRFFNFKRYLSPLRGAQWGLSFMNFLVIGFGFYILSSQFLFAPGLNVNLPCAKEEALSGAFSASILTVVSDNMLLFEGCIYDRKGIKKVLKSSQKASSVLVIKCDQEVSMQIFFEVCQVAKKAGYTSIHIAAQKWEKGEAWADVL